MTTCLVFSPSAAIFEKKKKKKKIHGCRSSEQLWSVFLFVVVVFWGSAGIRLPVMGQGEVGAWTLSVTRPVSAESRSTEGWGMMPLLFTQ